MQQELTPSQAADKVNEALDALARHTPALREVLAAFRPLMAAQASLKAQLPTLDQRLPQVDAARLAQGVPLAGADDFLHNPELALPDYLEQAAGQLLPALAQGFTAMTPETQALRAALDNKTFNAAACLEDLLSGRQEQFEAHAGQTGLRPASLAFILLQLAKPLLEKRAQALAGLLTEQDWSQGSCPLCGSLPEMAFLQGEGGQRWLRCSLCGHHWRFSRTVCPVCANEDPEQLGFFFAEGRERERVESCQQCGKYLVSLDTRGLDQPPLWEVAALGLVHLDLLAQDKGLTPAAWCAWNQIK